MQYFFCPGCIYVRDTRKWIQFLCKPME